MTDQCAEGLAVDAAVVAEDPQAGNAVRSKVEEPNWLVRARAAPTEEAASGLVRKTLQSVGAEAIEAEEVVVVVVVDTSQSLCSTVPLNRWSAPITAGSL